LNYLEEKEEASSQQYVSLQYSSNFQTSKLPHALETPPTKWQVVISKLKTFSRKCPFQLSLVTTMWAAGLENLEMISELERQR
jgi:hypothetical protein